jgi:hypothetical protein
MSFVWDAGRKVRGELDRDFPVRVPLRCRCGLRMGFLCGTEESPQRHYINGAVPQEIFRNSAARFQHYRPRPPRTDCTFVFFNPTTGDIDQVPAGAGVPAGTRVTGLVFTLPPELTEGTLYIVLGSAPKKSKAPSDRGKCRADWRVSFEVLLAAYRRAVAKPPQERVIVLPYDLQPVPGRQPPMRLDGAFIGSRRPVTAEHGPRTPTGQPH